MVTDVALLNEGREKLTADKLTTLIGQDGVKTTGFFDHSKASERYVIVSVAKGSSVRKWHVPYYYRRTDVRVDSIAELADYVKKSIGLLTAKRISWFKSKFRKCADELFGKNSSVTLPIFRTLLDDCGKWVWNKKFPGSNPQRRIQDLKEKGFTIATKIESRKTYHMLMPFDVVRAPTYETFSPKARKAISDALGGIDAFSGKPAAISALPDHKFPEIRWEAGVEESNEGLGVEDARAKFQLVPERVNQAKREVYRKCFQTGIRGKLNGIDFYYHGDEKWPSGVPATGVAAKKGCAGCFWYDMSAWREALNKLIKSKR